MTVVNWIAVFTRKNHCDAIIESLKYCQKLKGLHIFAYCIMSNHIHMLVNTNEPFELKDVVRDFKKFTSKKILFQIQNEPESRREWMLKLFEDEAEKNIKTINFGKLEIMLLKSIVQNLPGRKLITCTII